MKKLIWVYPAIALATYLFFFMSNTLENKILFSLIFAAVLTALLIPILPKEKKIGLEEGFMRYTMLCRDCGWEWMSNTTTKIPQKCPNCNEKNRLEVLGWRKVKILPRAGEDLRAFLK